MESAVATLAILVPCTLGFHLLVRWPKGRLRRSSTLVHRADLGDLLRPLGHPLVVGTVGTRHAEIVAGQVLDFADLMAVPLARLRAVPPNDVQRQATVTARILTAQCRDPLRHYLGRPSVSEQEWPF
jgi:hypothetical protein